MPKIKKAPGKLSHAQATTRLHLQKITNFALDMEVPLNDAMHFVLALRLIADGMDADRDDKGRAIAAVARAALHRLDTLQDVWCGLVKAAQRQTAA